MLAIGCIHSDLLRDYLQKFATCSEFKSDWSWCLKKGQFHACRPDCTCICGPGDIQVKVIFFLVIADFSEKS